MKNTNKFLSILAISGVFALTSCDNDDDNTGASMIDYNNVSATVSTDENSYTFSEMEIDEEDPATFRIPVTVELEEAIPVDAIIDIVLASGGDAADFTTNPIVVPAGQTTAIGSINLVQNGQIEGDETLVFEAVSRANVNLNDFSVTVNIEDDYINDVLEITVDWSGTHTESGPNQEITYDFCGIDFDLLILDENGADTEMYDAATASCPEHIDLSGLEDGTYYLLLSLYENTFAADGLDVPVPVTISYNQEYFQSGEIVISDFNLNSDPEDIIVASIVVEDGYIYTIEQE